MISRRWLLAGSLCVSAVFAQGPRKAAIDRNNLVDLSYAYDAKTLYWPTSPPFEWKKDTWGKTDAGYWYASATFTTSEHGGTHLDAPLHFAEGKWSAADIPVSRLVAPVDVIDVAAACAKDRDYLVKVADVDAWERRHGKIAEGDIVLIRTGWGQYWPDAKKYLGSDKRGTTDGLSFPGIGVEAARLLAERKPAGVGIDTASIDYGKSQDYQTHRVLTAANVFGLENVANLERVPEAGATLIALPVKIAGGSGGPLRIVAVLP